MKQWRLVLLWASAWALARATGEGEAEQERRRLKGVVEDLISEAAQPVVAAGAPPVAAAELKRAFRVRGHAAARHRNAADAHSRLPAAGAAAAVAVRRAPAAAREAEPPQAAGVADSERQAMPDDESDAELAHEEEAEDGTGGEVDPALAFISRKLSKAEHATGALRHKLAATIGLDQRLQRRLASEHTSRQATARFASALGQRAQAAHQADEAATRRLERERKELSADEAAARSASAAAREARRELEVTKRAEGVERQRQSDLLQQDKRKGASFGEEAARRERQLDAKLQAATSEMRADDESLRRLRDRLNSTSSRLEGLRTQNAELLRQLQAARAGNARLGAEVDGNGRAAQQQGEAEEAERVRRQHEQDALQGRALADDAAREARVQQLRQEIAQERAAKSRADDAWATQHQRQTSLIALLQDRLAEAKKRSQDEFDSLHAALRRDDAALEASRQELNSSLALAQQQRDGALAQERRLARAAEQGHVEADKQAVEAGRLGEEVRLGQNESADLERKLVHGRREQRQQVSVLRKKLQRTLVEAAGLRQDRDALLVNLTRSHSRASSLAERVENLTGALREADSRAQRLRAQAGDVQRQLDESRARGYHLSMLAKSLRIREQEGDRAQAEAHDALVKAQHDMVAAQEVARQLSGTVPQLLEQARAASAQVETENAIREQEHADRLKTENQLNQVSPSHRQERSAPPEAAESIADVKAAEGIAEAAAKTSVEVQQSEVSAAIGQPTEIEMLQTAQAAKAAEQKRLRELRATMVRGLRKRNEELQRQAEERAEEQAEEESMIQLEERRRPKVAHGAKAVDGESKEPPGLASKLVHDAVGLQELLSGVPGEGGARD